MWTLGPLPQYLFYYLPLEYEIADKMANVCSLMASFSLVTRHHFIRYRHDSGRIGSFTCLSIIQCAITCGRIKTCETFLFLRNGSQNCCQLSEIRRYCHRQDGFLWQRKRAKVSGVHHIECPKKAYSDEEKDSGVEDTSHILQCIFQIRPKKITKLVYLQDPLKLSGYM